MALHLQALGHASAFVAAASCWPPGSPCSRSSAVPPSSRTAPSRRPSRCPAPSRRTPWPSSSSGCPAPAPTRGSGRVVFAVPTGQSSATAQSRRQADRRARSTKVAVTSPRATDPFAAARSRRTGASPPLQFTFREAATDARPPRSRRPSSGPGVGREAGVRVLRPVTPRRGRRRRHPPEVIGLSSSRWLVLTITFGSLLAAGLPLLTAADRRRRRRARHHAGQRLHRPQLDRHHAWPLMLGLAVGIDYALFILSRHRTQVHDGHGPSRSPSASAVGTAGSAVVFAGATVIIALVALAVTGVPFLAAMGLAAAATVAVAVLLASRSCPALLGFAGARGRQGQDLLDGRRRDAERPTLGARWIGARDPPPRGRDRRRRRRSRSALPPSPRSHMRLGLPDDGDGRPGDDAAPGLRPAQRGLRPRLQRPAHGRRRRWPGSDAQRGRRRDRRTAAGLEDVAAVAPADAQPGRDLAIIVGRSRRAARPRARREDLVTTIRDEAAAIRADTARVLRHRPDRDQHRRLAADGRRPARRTWPSSSAWRCCC